MSGLDVRFAGSVTVCFTVMLFCGQSSANALPMPTDPNNLTYYESFQKVSSPNVTAEKLMVNFLHIRPKFFDRVKKWAPTVEDIVIVMDGSESINKCEFEKGKKALKGLMSMASYNSRDDTKYAAVTFSCAASVNFKFLTYPSAGNKILSISYPGGGSNTQAGLAEAKKLFDDPSSGRRDNSRKVVFLFTDGQWNEFPHLTIPKANALKAIGVDIYVVAVGRYISGIDEMVKVASSPPENYVFRVEKNSALWDVVKLVIKEVNPGKYAVLNGQYDPPCS